MHDGEVTDPASAVLLDGLDTVREWQGEFYRDLHAHPELSHREHRTATNVAARLRIAGLEVHDGIGGTGVVGLVRNGNGPTVLLRADMDALPVHEETGLAYASKETSDDGTAVMHACGHDVHVTCLLGAATLLAAATDRWAGTMVALFQPAEETADGARGMLEDGLRSIVGDVDVAMAQHVLPFTSGTVGTRAGPTLSAADSMRIIVHGRGAHGSMPQAAIDPVVLTAMIVVRLQTVVAREVAPGDTAVLTVGSIQAGTKSNVIPDHAVLQLNVRTQSAYHRRAERDVAATGPIDDVQWWDRESLDVLAFAARRLPPQSVFLVITCRGTAPPAPFAEGFPILEVGPLPAQAAETLLEAQPHAPRGRARKQVLDQARGAARAHRAVPRASCRSDSGSSLAHRAAAADRAADSGAGRAGRRPPRKATRQALLLVAVADRPDLALRVPSLDVADLAPAELAALSMSTRQAHGFGIRSSAARPTTR